MRAMNLARNAVHALDGFSFLSLVISFLLSYRLVPLATQENRTQIKPASLSVKAKPKILGWGPMPTMPHTPVEDLRFLSYSAGITR